MLGRLFRVELLVKVQRLEQELFFFNDTATTEIYTLSLHDALPICWSTADFRARYGTSRPESCSCGTGIERGAWLAPTMGFCRTVRSCRRWRRVVVQQGGLDRPGSMAGG